MGELKSLFENNQKWAKSRIQKDKNFFKKNADHQSPQYLWIGCSDSRVPPNEVIGLEPGEIFVHRNIANVVPHTDMNCLSVLEYAVVHLGVEHVIVCGHYGCGGVAAAMENAQFGLVDHWLREIRDIYFKQKDALDRITDKKTRQKRLVELNVLSQVLNVSHTTIVQNAWEEGKKLTIHGWVYDIATGLVNDLNCSTSSMNQIGKTYQTV